MKSLANARAKASHALTHLTNTQKRTQGLTHRHTHPALALAVARARAGQMERAPASVKVNARLWGKNGIKVDPPTFH